MDQNPKQTVGFPPKSGPFDDLRVLDLTRVLAGPYATMILGDLGAEIIKVEQPEIGDEARGFGPFQNDFSLYFMSVNRGKKSITLNLKTDQGQQIFHDLLAKCDVLVENFRAGTMAKLGLGYDQLREKYPGLIYAACSGFGQTGPYANRGAYDMIIQAMGGILSITGEPDQPPVRVGTSIGDITSALFTTIGVLSALHHRQKTGKGQLVDVGMLDCQVSILENALVRYFSSGEVPKPLGRRHPAITPFEVFESKDGYVVIAIGNDQLWQRFCQHVDRSDLVDDPRFKNNSSRTNNHSELRAIMNKVLSQKDTVRWVEELAKIGVPCGPVNTIDKVVEDPQIRARDMIVDLSTQFAGKVQIPGIPVKLSQTPGQVDEPAPMLGQHTEEVLANLLGIPKTEIHNLQKLGII